MRSACATSSGRWAMSSTVRPAPSRCDGAAHVLHARGIEVGRRLVEDDERRIAQERARQPDPPALARRQRAPTVADDRLVAAGQGAARRRRRRRARRPRAPRASEAGRPRRMLSATLPRTSAGCWGTHATSARQSSARQPARSTPPTVTRPAVGSRNPSSSAATVLLPAPLSPDERHGLARRQLEVEPVEDEAGTRRIGEGDALQAHRRRRGARDRPRPSRARRGRRVEQREHPVGDRQPVGARVVLGAQPAQRQVQLGREHEHRQPGLEPEPAVDQPHADRHRDERDAEGGRQLEHGPREEA